MNDGLKDMHYRTLIDILAANLRVELVVLHWTLRRSGRT